jgi:hypothetical protein
MYITMNNDTEKKGKKRPKIEKVKSPPPLPFCQKRPKIALF